MTTRFAVTPGWVKADLCPAAGRDGVRALHYEDGTVHIEHRCKVVDGEQFITAPALRIGDGHAIEQTEPLTVSPSILCPDCGLHGFIRRGRWEPC